MPDSGQQLTFAYLTPQLSVYMQIDRDGTRLGPSRLAQMAGACRDFPIEAGRPAWRLVPPVGPPEPLAQHVESAGNSKLVPFTWKMGHHGPLNQVVFSPDGKLLATASDDNSAGIVEVSAQGQGVQPMVHLTGHTNRVLGFAWAPDAKKVVTTSLDQTARLWDLEHHSWLILEDHKSGVHAAVFSPDGKTLATGAMDRSVKVRDAVDGRVRYTVELPGEKGDMVAALTLCPDGKTFVAGGGSWDEVKRGAVAAWDLATGKPRWSISKNLAAVWGLAVSPDGQTLALACLDGTLRLCDAATGKERSVLHGHVDRAIGVVFTPSGKTLASCGYDNTIRLWDVATGLQKVQRAAHLLGVQRIAISPDGKVLASGGSEGRVILWRIEE
jgi:WD40 repeat protein